MASKKKTAQARKRSRPIEPKKTKIDSNILIVIVLAAIVIIAIGLFLTLGNSDDDNQDNNNENNDNQTTSGNPIAIIDTSMGTIKVELFKDKVPNTVDNFIKLANAGFYEDLVFHRVMDDFMIQGGGFSSDGIQKQSPYGTIDLEISVDVRHVDGAIAMARTNDPNSATSQFYICDGAQSFLDDNYAAFGVTIEGIDIVRAIALVDTTTKNGMQNWPVEDVIINKITIEE